MIIADLHEYAKRRGLDCLYQSRKISYTILLDPDGKFLGLDATAKSAMAPRNDSRGNVIRAAFGACDTATFVLGQSKKLSVVALEARHAAFIESVDTLTEEANNDPGVLAVRNFLQGAMPKKIQNLSCKGEEWVTFQIQGDPGFVFERPAVRDAWERDRKRAASEGVLDTCRVTGERAVCARLHPQLALPDAKGCKLLAFNQGVFEFEGRSQGSNYPVSVEVAENYGAAIRYMLAETDTRQHRQVAFYDAPDSSPGTRKGYSLFLYTMDGRCLDDLLDVIDINVKDPEARQARLLAAWDGLQAWASDAELLHGFVLKSATARIMILETFARPLSEIVGNLLRFRDELGGRPLNHALFLLRGADKKPTRHTLSILRSVLLGYEYPRDLLTTPSHVWLQAANTRLNKGNGPMSYDPNNQVPAYQLGVLAQQIERFQHRAYPNSVKGRHTLMALRSPRAGYEVLCRQAHIYKGVCKTKKEYISAEDMAAFSATHEHLSALPTSFGVEERSQFWAGFYQRESAAQREYADSLAKKAAKQNAKLAGEATPENNESDKDDDKAA